MHALAEVLAGVDRDAAAPVVTLLRATPVAFETELRRAGRDMFAGLLDAPALAAVDRVLAAGAGARSLPPPAVELIAVPSLPAAAPVWLERETAAAWATLARAAAAETGAAPVLASGYRSPAYQAALVLWLHHELGYDPAATARRAQAPAASEHCRPVRHALDLVTPASNADPARPEGFAATPAYAWMRERAAAFGFHQSFPAEPWHWRLG